MPKYNLIQTLEDAMRYIYSHFLEEGESLDAFMQSVKSLRPQIRHTVRRVIYENIHCSLLNIAQAERRFDGKNCSPRATTISLSIRISQELHTDKRGLQEVQKLFDQWNDYRRNFELPGLKKRLEQLQGLPKSALVVVLSTAVEFGHIRPEVFEGLLVEFGSISEQFLKETLKEKAV